MMDSVSLGFMYCKNRGSRGWVTFVSWLVTLNHRSTVGGLVDASTPEFRGSLGIEGGGAGGVQCLPTWKCHCLHTLAMGLKKGPPVWKFGPSWWGRHEIRDSSRACRTFCYRTTMGLEVEDARENLPEEATSNLKLTG